ncbi:MAG: cytochrome c oxidase subunit 3 [Methylocapsa sp.]|nr:cytochrome c oxidase subunit 3 [Methylocapsa sp.]
MNITILFLAVLAAIAIGWLYQQRITSKPWLEAGVVVDHGLPAHPPAKTGLWVFLAVAGTLFALFFSAYVVRTGLPEPNAVDLSTLPAPKLLWLNTFVLTLSSAALQWAQHSARRMRPGKVTAGLLASGALAFLFLAGQLIAWRQMIAQGYFLATSPASSFFYLIIGVHGLHLLGGLVALTRTTGKALAGFPMRKLRLSVELCAIYWHFLLVVWLIFFALLLFTGPAVLDKGVVSFICSIF